MKKSRITHTVSHTNTLRSCTWQSLLKDTPVNEMLL